MGYPRLPVEKQCELAPTLLTAMEGKPQPQQDRYGSLTSLLPICKSHQPVPFVYWSHLVLLGKWKDLGLVT